MNSKSFIVKEFVVEIFEDAKKNNERAELEEAASSEDRNAHQLKQKNKKYFQGFREQLYEATPVRLSVRTASARPYASFGFIQPRGESMRGSVRLSVCPF